jgi:hypothetical protein
LHPEPIRWSGNMDLARTMDFHSLWRALLLELVSGWRCKLLLNANIVRSAIIGSCCTL